MLQFENAEEQIREFARLFFRLAASRQLDLACRMPDERVRLNGPEKLILLARALAISALRKLSIISKDRYPDFMNVNLTPELEQFVTGKVSSGRYNSASEVVREALRLLEEQDKIRASQLAQLNAELSRRLASLDRGETVKGEEVFARIKMKSQDRRKKRA